MKLDMNLLCEWMLAIIIPMVVTIGIMFLTGSLMLSLFICSLMAAYLTLTLIEHNKEKFNYKLIKPKR